MEHIGSVTDLGDADVEALFKTRAQEALRAMDIPKFAGDGLSLARTEKEIAKCTELAGHLEHKRTLKSRDRQNGNSEAREKRKPGRKSPARGPGAKDKPHARSIKGRGKK